MNTVDHCQLLDSLLAAHPTASNNELRRLLDSMCTVNNFSFISTAKWYRWLRNNGRSPVLAWSSMELSFFLQSDATLPPPAAFDFINQFILQRTGRPTPRSFNAFRSKWIRHVKKPIRHGTSPKSPPRKRIKIPTPPPSSDDDDDDVPILSLLAHPHMSPATIPAPLLSPPLAHFQSGASTASTSFIAPASSMSVNVQTGEEDKDKQEKEKEIIDLTQLDVIEKALEEIKRIKYIKQLSEKMDIERQELEKKLNTIENAVKEKSRLEESLKEISEIVSNQEGLKELVNDLATLNIEKTKEKSRLEGSLKTK